MNGDLGCPHAVKISEKLSSAQMHMTGFRKALFKFNEKAVHAEVSIIKGTPPSCRADFFFTVFAILLPSLRALSLDMPGRAIK